MQFWIDTPGLTSTSVFKLQRGDKYIGVYNTFELTSTLVFILQLD